MPERETGEPEGDASPFAAYEAAVSATPDIATEPPAGGAATESPADGATEGFDDGPDDEPELAPPGRPAPLPARTPASAKRRRTLRRVLEWAALVAMALGVAFVLRTFVVQSFYIPSTSMVPTLEVGDRVLVNKLAYRLGDPSRGDVIVFEAPPGEGTDGIKDLIKRIIGLPGETIEGRDGRVYIDGELLEEPWLPGGIRSRTFGPEVVPEGEYWVMGDNRQNSRDSTFFKSIPESTIIGKAFIRIWPLRHFGGL